MHTLPFINHPEKFQKELKRLVEKRKVRKHKPKEKHVLTIAERKIILSKTDGKCHMCGDEITVEKFDADYIKPAAKGKKVSVDNFLPACGTCNSYRWHFLPEEFKWILKLGIYVRTEIANNTLLGNEIADAFIRKEMEKEKKKVAAEAGVDAKK